MRFVAGIAAILVVGVTSAAASASSPLGLWKGENGYTYRYVPLAGGGFSEISLTPHRTSHNRCLIPRGTTVYRYHPLGGGIYSVDAFLWRTNCSTRWVKDDERRRITVSGTRMTLSCDRNYSKPCFSYRRLDAARPVVHALASTGVVGGDTVLRYTVSDDSGRTREEFTIYKGNSALRHYKAKLGPAVRGQVYAYTLHGTPATMRGRFQFCVVSHDAAGNSSKESCAEVTIR